MRSKLFFYCAPKIDQRLAPSAASWPRPLSKTRQSGGPSGTLSIVWFSLNVDKEFPDFSHENIFRAVLGITETW